MLLEGTTNQNVDEALEDLWQLKIPLKPTTFAWRLIKDTIPTKENLQRRQLEKGFAQPYNYWSSNLSTVFFD